MSVDELELTTVGIDIGSATSHLAFSKVGLQTDRTSLKQVCCVSRDIISASEVEIFNYNSKQNRGMGTCVLR